MWRESRRRHLGDARKCSRPTSRCIGWAMLTASRHGWATRSQGVFTVWRSGGLFAAESMFYRIPDGSKVALVALASRCATGFTLLDVQMTTPHTERMAPSTFREATIRGDCVRP